MKKLLCAVLLVAGLTACAEYKATETKVLSAPWLSRQITHDPAPIYCYRTLADPECFAAALPERRAGLVGYFGPGPQPN